MKNKTLLKLPRYVSKLGSGDYYQVTISGHYVGCFSTVDDAVEHADFFLLELLGAKSKWKLNNPLLVQSDATVKCDKCSLVKQISEYSQPKSKNYHKLYCNACVVEQKNRRKEQNRLKWLQYTQESNGISPSAQYRKSLNGCLSFLISCAKQRVKNRNYDCDLTLNDLKSLYDSQMGLCALSGKKMTWGSGEGRVPTNISIDRINRKFGYTKSNVQLVCDFVNNMKGTMSNKQIVEWCKSVVEHSGDILE